MEITDRQIEPYFNALKSYLLESDNIFTTRQVNKQIPKDIGAGVYFIFDDNKLCYVGESGSLHGRLKDFHKTLNHTFRRSLGEFKYASHPKYYKASSFKKFDNEIEFLLDEYILKKITISYKAIKIGRKEFEDWMQAKHTDINFLNKRKQRRLPL